MDASCESPNGPDSFSSPHLLLHSHAWPHAGILPDEPDAARDQHIQAACRLILPAAYSNAFQWEPKAVLKSARPTSSTSGYICCIVSLCHELRCRVPSMSDIRVMTSAEPRHNLHAYADCPGFSMRRPTYCFSADCELMSLMSFAQHQPDGCVAHRRLATSCRWQMHQ